MEISVVVPLYNKVNWVRRALDSIAAQTFWSFEVIVVDDGSTDGSAEVAENYPDPRFRLVRQPNGGPGAARNRGIAESRGRLLAFLDADDEWHPRFLESSVNALLEAGEDVAAAVCGHVVMPAGTTREKLWRRRGVREGIFRATPTESALRFIHQLAFMSPCATVIRAEVLARHGGFYARDRCTYGEDAYLFLKVMLNEAVSFRFEPLVTFHMDASGLSSNYRGPRPLEPFLRFSEEFELSCPRHLKPLLREMLSIRASKTACMYAWWGEYEVARLLLSQFSRDRRWWHPWAMTAELAATPAGALTARMLRDLRGVVRRRRAALPAVAPATSVMTPAEFLQGVPRPEDAGVEAPVQRHEPGSAEGFAPPAEKLTKRA